MVHLSQETEALARRLAAAQGISVEAAIKQALERSAHESGLTVYPVTQRDTSPQAVADRMSKIDKIVDEIARMPILDPRSPREIMDYINAL